MCLDDFGDEYSYSIYLNSLPIDILKIDRSFIQALVGEASKPYKLVKSIIDLAHNLELQVVAEGIETLCQLEYLKNLGCQYGQGYLFSPAVSPATVKNLVNNLTQLQFVQDY